VWNVGLKTLRMEKLFGIDARAVFFQHSDVAAVNVDPVRLQFRNIFGKMLSEHMWANKGSQLKSIFFTLKL
jgi:hypothetical protein